MLEFFLTGEEDRRMRLTALVSLFVWALLGGVMPAQAWEPTRPIEFVVPAGTGGGADQMARLIAGIAEKHKLSPRPIIVVNKSGGAGAEGFLYVKGKKGDAAHHHHHPVESLYDPAAYRSALQLA